MENNEKKKTVAGLLHYMHSPKISVDSLSYISPLIIIFLICLLMYLNKS